MPVRIALRDLVESLRLCLHSYWQIRAANAAMLHFSSSGFWTGFSLDFDGVPLTTEFSSPQRVLVGDALREIQDYVRGGRAATDFFLTIISHFEAFLSAVLGARGLSTEGTLGALIARANVAYAIVQSSHTELVAEVRERRNAIIHSHGRAVQRYIAAATAPSLPSHIRSVTYGQVLTIDDSYLAYVCDGLIAYARQY